MSISTQEVKQELGDRAKFVSQKEFLDSNIRPLLGLKNGKEANWENKLIQLDGTGACSVEIKMNGEQIAFLKLFPDNDGEHVYEKLKKLRAAGFGEGERYQSVEPLGYIPEYRLMLTRPAPGVAVSESIGADYRKLEDGARESAMWLAKLHSSSIRMGKNKCLLESGELLPLARRLIKMISRRPNYLSLALGMIEELEKVAEDTVEQFSVPGHGQYRPIHVFTNGSTVTVIDLDRGRPCDPARDIAEFLHRTRMTTYWREGSVEHADASTRAFLEAYDSAVVNRSFLDNLRFHWARYIFHSLNNKLKGLNSDDSELDSTVSFYRSEFDKALNNFFIP